MAEASYEPNSSFWTLTYDDEQIPLVVDGPYYGSPTLRPKDLILFFKRWRKLKPKEEAFRYFSVGEYGDKFGRPHYHLVAFGPRLDVTLEGRVKDIWGKGRVSVSELNSGRASYCAGYTLKKMTKADDNRLLPGQYPEFFRCSRKPALGYRMVDDIGRACTTHGGAYLMAESGDVPKEFRIEGRRYAVGRYWVRRLREMLDGPEKADLGKIKAEQATPEYRARLEEAAEKEKKLFRQQLKSRRY